MSNDKHHINKDRNSFLDYSSHRMSDKERNAFERKMQKDPFFAEAQEGLSSISLEKAAGDFIRLDQRLNKRLTIKKRILRYRMYAATAAILLACASLLTLYHDELGIFPSPMALSEKPENDQGPVSYGADPVTQPKVDTKDETAESVPKDLSGAGAKSGAASGAATEDMELMKEESYQEMEPPTEKRSPVMTAPAALAKGIIISSEDNMPVGGAMVNLKGTPVVTSTNMQGQFEISVPQESDVSLVADFIGMEQKEINIENNEEMTIIMEPSAEAMDEIIIESSDSRKKLAVSRSAKSAQATEDLTDSGYESSEPLIGKKQFKEHIEKNLNFPTGSNLSRAVVVLSFVINEDGKPEKISVLKSPGEAFSTEAIRLLVQGPAWSPSMKDGAYYPEETRIRMVLTK